MIKAECEKQRKRIYMFDQLKKEGTPKSK
jgi:hypothetical protein